MLMRGQQHQSKKRTCRPRSYSSSSDLEPVSSRSSLRNRSLSNGDLGQRENGMLDLTTPSESNHEASETEAETSMRECNTTELAQISSEMNNAGLNFSLPVTGTNSSNKTGKEIIKGSCFESDFIAAWNDAKNPDVATVENGDKIIDFLKENIRPLDTTTRRERFTPLGPSICLATDKLKELLDMLGPHSTREDLILNPINGPNQVLPATIEKFEQAISLANKRRNKIRNHFKGRTRTISREFRTAWYSLVVHHAEPIQLKLQEIIDNKPSDRELQAMGLAFPEQFDNLIPINEALKIFLRVKANPRAVLELFASGKTLAYVYIPPPMTDGIYHFVHGSLAANLPEIPTDQLIINAGQIMNHLLNDLGMTYINTNNFRAVIGMHKIANGDIEFKLTTGNMICVSSSPTAVTSSNKYSLNLYRFTIRALLISKFKISPKEIDFNNIDNLKSLSADAYNWLIKLYINIHKSPLTLNRLIENDSYDDELTIIRSKSNPTQQEDQPRMKPNEKRIKDDLLMGKITAKPFPKDIPPPMDFVKATATRTLSNTIQEYWTKRRDRELDNTSISKFDNSRAARRDDSGQPDQDDGNSSFNKNKQPKPGTIPSISNPTATNISEMKTLCLELNKLNKENLVNLKCLNCNPGLCSGKGEKFRDLINEVKNVDIITANELRQEMEFYRESSCWPEGFKCHTHNKIKTCNLAYSAILTRNATVDDYIKETCSFGTITGILLENERGQKLCIFSIYRPIKRDNSPNCFYKRYGNNDPFIFVSWLKQARAFARKHDAGVILAGDYNSAFDRLRDDDKLSAAILEALKGLVDLCVDPTFFKKNCPASSIDHIYVSDPRNTNCKNLRLHKTLNYDGHCGQVYYFNFGVPKTAYKVMLGRKLDSDSTIKNKALAIFPKVVKAIHKAKTPEERVQASFKWTKKLLLKCSTKVIKIQEDKSEFAVEKGCDTIQYQEMKKVVSRIKTAEPTIPRSETHALLSKLGVIIKKLKLRDKREARRRLSNKAEGDRNIVWDIFNEQCRPNQLWNVDKEFTPDELADRVQELQESTASKTVLKNPLFDKIPAAKLEYFPFSINGENQHPSILEKFHQLKSHTKGWSGVNKQFLDLLPIAFMEPLVVNPVRDCLEHGMYPEILRYSRVTILPKKQKGIRPLAIAEPINSVLEKVIIGSLNKFIEGIDGLPDQQSGFRSSRSCGTALFEIMKFYEDSIAKNKVIALILLDAKNAFGSLNHESLIVVLKSYFCGRALLILEQSLLRYFVVNTRGFYSSLRKGSPHGVPQGGDLKSPLFSFFTLAKLLT
ncbi:unnamed protein product [Oikopleura dioica]|uniref:Reverse transcriptase domain-containing protein n=1 Tax=Oikopleura dioica TaxID=34765 RepID=E4Y6H2_OIKDI|nr:unnamed protein product [Oikopleura dioica]